MNNNMEVGRNTVGFGLSAAIVSVLSGLLVVIKETHPDTILAWMKRVTVHHWVTHGIIDVVLFVAIGLILSKANGGKGVKMSVNTLIAVITAAVVIGWVTIAGFNFLEL